MTGLAAVGQMEWIKLRSLRSTAWIFVIFTVSMVGLAILDLGFQSSARLTPAQLATWDPTAQGFEGLAVAGPLMGVLGILAITGEYSSGLIRTTLAAVPRRPRVLAAKAAVVGAVTLVAGEVLAFAGFLAGEAVLAGSVPHASLGQATVARAVLMAGAVPALLGLIGLGLGALVRHTVGAVSLFFGLLFVLPALLLPLPDYAEIIRYTPLLIVQNSLIGVRPVVAHALGAWPGLLLMCLYAVAALAAGGWALARRDG